MRQERQARGIDGDPRARRGDHFPGVAEKTEAGDVGRAGGAGVARDTRGHAVEAQHAGDGGGERGVRRGAVLGGGGDHAGTERLGQEEPVARPKAALDQHAVGVNAPRDAEAILGLVVDDGVAPRDDPARLGDLLGAAAEDLGHDGLVHLAREARDGEREHHLPAHRVDVRHRVGRGDGAPGPRVVHHGREEVHRLDERQVVADAVDRRVVGRTESDHEIARRLLREDRPAQHAQHLLEISRSHLRRSAGAGGVGGEADLLARGRRPAHVDLDGRSRGWDSRKSRNAWASGERVRSRCVTR